MPASTAAVPSLGSVALLFAKISATSFGGGQKASIRQAVLAQGWMPPDAFMDGLEIAQVLPGPNILNLAIYCGQRVRGVPGALAAFAGASLPPFAIVLVAGALYFQFASNPFVHGALRGCAAGALGLTIGNALELTWDERRSWFGLALIVVTALAVSLLRMPLLVVMALFGGAGVLVEARRMRKPSVG
ncbi:MAG: chromate transporter [Candidatus Cybelea sp.]